MYLLLGKMLLLPSEEVTGCSSGQQAEPEKKHRAKNEEVTDWSISVGTS